MSRSVAAPCWALRNCCCHDALPESRARLSRLLKEIQRSHEQTRAKTKITLLTLLDDDDIRGTQAFSEPVWELRIRPNENLDAVGGGSVRRSRYAPSGDRAPSYSSTQRRLRNSQTRSQKTHPFRGSRRRYWLASETLVIFPASPS